MPDEEEIKQLAYTLWEQEGYPEGKDVEHYYAAERILLEREAAAARASQVQKAPPALKAPFGRGFGSRSRKTGK